MYSLLSVLWNDYANYTLSNPAKGFSGWKSGCTSAYPDILGKLRFSARNQIVHAILLNTLHQDGDASDRQIKHKRDYSGLSGVLAFREELA